LIQGSPQAEAYDLTAYGPEWLLGKNVVRGKWFADSDVGPRLILGQATEFDTNAPSIVDTRIPCVFNEDGLPNMSPESWDIAPPGTIDISRASGGAVFAPSDLRVINDGKVTYEARKWTAYRALRSMVEWVDRYEVISSSETDWDAIASTLGNIEIGEVDIDGKDVLGAIREILSPLGFGFRLNVISDGLWKHALVVYSLKPNGAGKQPYLPPLNSDITDANGSRAEVSRLDFVRDTHNTRNSITVVGQPKRLQLT
ncbi:unnamed protein product, partial [marine sediment metagenome]